MTRARRARKARTPITMPAMAPPESELDDEAASVSLSDGTTIGVEVTVCVTASPEMVTTRVLVTGDGVADSGMYDDELDSVVASWTGEYVEDVDGGGVELDVVLGADDDDYRTNWSAGWFYQTP